MTAAVPEPTRSAAPQAMSEQHTVTLESIQKRDVWRFWMLVFGFGALAILVVVPLFVHQIIQYGQARPPGQAHQGESPRGNIVDRNGALLAADRFSYEVSATPSYFRSEEERMEAARLLEELAGIPAAETFNLLSTYADLKFVRLAPAISLEAGRRILEEQAILAEESGVHPLLNVTLTPTPQRYYPERAVGAQVVGSLAILGDAAWTQGVSGIEDYYDQYLRKRDGVGLTGRSFSKLSELPADVRRFLPSVAGKDLILTLDRNVQWIAEEELQWALTQFRAQSGTIIVMDPRTGEILAMANSPTFDPNDLSKADMAAVQNTAISAQYEPGSVFKMITAAAALDSGVVTPTQTLTDTGSIAVGQRVILNSDRVAHGVVDMTEALARSLNVITAQWALMLGQKQFYQYLERFGFGQVTEVDLADEVYGLIKRPGTLDWSLSDLGTNSFGQGLAVTPIQMANAIASIANGGKLMRPYIVKARVLDGQVQFTEPTVLGTTIRPETAKALTDILVNIVTDGNSAAAVPGYRIAGKSGTAQIPTEEGYTEDETIVTFAGYAPADDPRFVILVKLDRPDPNISRWASYTAAPAFSRVARRLFYYYNIPPDQVRLGQVASN